MSNRSDGPLTAEEAAPAACSGDQAFGFKKEIGRRSVRCWHADSRHEFRKEIAEAATLTSRSSGAWPLPARGQPNSGLEAGVGLQMSFKRQWNPARA